MRLEQRGDGTFQSLLLWQPGRGREQLVGEGASQMSKVQFLPEESRKEPPWPNNSRQIFWTFVFGVRNYPVLEKSRPVRPQRSFSQDE